MHSMTNQFEFQLLPAATQELRIDLDGPSAMRMQTGLLENPVLIASLPPLHELASWTSEQQQLLPQPDVVPIFARAACAGLFSPQLPWEAHAEVLTTEVEAARQRRTYRIRLQGLDPGALRVLCNLLQLAGLDRMRLQTVEPLTPAATGFGDPRTWPYPGAAAVAFPVLMPVSGRIRVLRLVFRNPLTSAQARLGLSSLDAHAKVLMLGGYADEDAMRHSLLPAFVDPPQQADSYTIECVYLVMNSDWAALSAVVNLAHSLDHAGLAVGHVEFE